ncbi:carbohydrate binding domain-containing protein [Colwellia piezophila]|uniref:carbohydrate binding domain-containing protein n=1 Tax=Colwellia piezophila TaxID=211668 RepID=UPI00036EB8BF|nr:carbohydrate binding domain-containing protein [Colwellia piezophila]
MNKKIIKLLLIISSANIAFSAQAQVNITVDTSNVVASDVSGKYGMNLNAGVDSDLNRDAGYTPLADALIATGAKYLRYPGGAKSQYFSWASAPYTDPSTNYWVPGAYADLASNTMDFDEFMTLTSQVGAQPHVNVAYNPNKGLGEALAAKWVKYANVTNNHNVKYWEIGNEMWQSNLGLTISSLCAVASSYSAAMKAEDPSIQIGISWKRGQVQDVINTCGSAIDFVAISDYTTYTGSYTGYKNGNNVDLVGVDESASKKIVVSEFAPTTWAGDADDFANSAGKGIINFDQIGQYLKSPNTLYASFWNTHWYDLSGYMFDAMDNSNNLLPVAQPMRLWADFIKDDLVQITSNESDVVTYAAYDDANGDLNLFLVNKGSSTHSTSIAITSPNNYESTAAVTRFKGSNEWDENPTLGSAASVNVSSGAISTSLPPTSITVISLKVVNVAVTGVSVSPATSTINLGAVKALHASTSPYNATNQTMTWASSNSSIAVVNASGVVTGEAPGNATITVSTIDGGYTDTAEITVDVITVPIITNPGFETGALDGWQSTETSGWAGVTSDGKHSGTFSGWAGGGSAELRQTITNLQPSTTYDVSAYVYNWNSDGGSGTVGVDNSGGVWVSQSFGYTDWTLVELSFTTGASNTSADIYMSSPSNSDTWVRVDDITIAEVAAPINSLVTNGDFENSLNGWSTWNTVNTNSNAYDGAAAVALSGKASVNQTITVQPNTSYTYSAYVKVEDPQNERVVMGVNDMSNGNSSIGGVQIYDTQYTYHEISFTTSANTTSVKVFLWRPNNGVNNAYMDNAVLVED